MRLIKSSKALWLAILMVGTLALGLVACGGKEAEAPSVSPLDEDQAIEVARSFVDRFTAGEYAEAFGDHPFDTTMENAFPPEVMEQLAGQLQDQYGDVLEVGGLETSNVQGFFVVSVGVRHERQDLSYNVVFNDAGKIGGFNYREIPSIDTLGQPEDATEKDPTSVTFGSEAYPVEGTRLLPEGEGPFPAAVLVQGSGASDRDETIGPNKPFRDIAEGLVGRGIAVLRYDKRTFAHVNAYLDPEVLEALTIYGEVIDDARFAVDYLAERDEIDPQAIYVIGHSLGGNQAPRIAEDQEHVAGIVIMGGNVTPLQDLMVDQYTYLFGLDDDTSDAETEAQQAEQLRQIKRAVERINADDLTKDTPAQDLMGVSARYWMDLRRYDPIEKALGLDKPILVLQGGRDYQVPPTEFEKWKEGLGEEASYRYYENLNHLFMAGEGTPTPDEYGIPGRVSEEVIDDIATWIQQQ